MVCTLPSGRTPQEPSDRALTKAEIEEEIAALRDSITLMEMRYSRVWTNPAIRDVVLRKQAKIVALQKLLFIAGRAQ